MAYEFFIGGRYFRTRRKQAFISFINILSVAGVTVGVMALIVVIAVMAGFEADLKSRILGVDAHIVLSRKGGPFTGYMRLADKVREMKGVLAATPYVSSQVMLRSETGVSGALLRGIDPASAGMIVKSFKNIPLEDRFRPQSGDLEKLESPGMILGIELARNMGVVKGDTVYIISPKGMLSPMGHIPVMKRFLVTDFFQAGMYEYDGSLAYIHMKDAQKLLRIGDRVSGIEIKVDDIYKADKVGARIISAFGLPYQAKDWMQMNKNLFSALKLEKTVMFIFLTLIILVAALNIASSLIMMVVEKTRDIGILKAMGATTKSIRKIFVYKGLVIGALGTSLGATLGMILCFLLKHYRFIELDPDVYYITTLPVKLDAMSFVLITSAAMLICFLSTLYPANQASRVDPVEAIRYG